MAMTVTLYRKGENVEDVMKEFGKHTDEEHGLWYSDESLKQIVQNKYNIKNKFKV